MDLVLNTEDWLKSIWQALRRIEGNLNMPTFDVPAPIINVPPVDLSEIVTAVTSLNTSTPTAEEIATAIAAVVTGAPQETEGNVMGELVKALEKLDFRLQGVGTQAYGGGAVSFSNAGITQMAEALNAGNKETPLTPQGYEQITDLSSVVALTPPGSAVYAMMQADGNPIRWRDDGVDPSATVGLRLPLNFSYWYTGSLAALRLVEEVSGAKLNVAYYS